MLDLNPLTHLRRLRSARRRRLARVRELPNWALGEVTLTASESVWLQRALLCCFGLPAHAAARPAGALTLRDAVAGLAARGLDLRVRRLDDAHALRRGDVVWLARALGARAGPAGTAGGLALVVDAGSGWLRLSPALADGPLTCTHGELQRLLGGWVLCARARPAGPAAVDNWDPSWSAAG